MDRIILESFSQRWSEEYISLFRNTFLLPPWNENWSRKKTERYLKKIMKKRGFSGLVLLIENNPVGFITGYTPGFFNHCFYIDQLFIDHHFQKRGLGRKLLQEFLTLLKNNGTRKICLKTLNKSPAEFFYCRMGFQPLVRLGKFRFLMY